MNLGIFLSPGESINLMKKTGQDVRFTNFYLKNYAKNFEKVYLFSYENEKPLLPKKVKLIPNRSSLHRLLYAMLLPIINGKTIGDCDVIRGFGLASSASALFLGKPFIFNWAYDYIKFAKIEKKFWYIPLYFVLEKLAFLKASFVLIATKNKAKAKKGDKFIYLPNGVDVSLFRNSGTHNDGIVYVGRFEKQKNLFFLLDVLSMLEKSKRVITFIGDGSLRQNLINYAAKKNISLKIIPPVKHSELPGILKRFSIFALPSYAEGNPKILLEAMAMGLVPVVTNFSTAKEIISNNQDGFITGYSPKDYYQKILTLIENRENLKRMSHNARRKILSHFNMEKILPKEITLLKDSVDSIPQNAE